MADTLNSFPIETKSWPDFTTHDDIQDSDLIMARRGSGTSPLTGSGLRSEISSLVNGGIDTAKGGINKPTNLIINSLGNINQDNVSGTVTLSASDYGHDMWKAGDSGCVYTFSSSVNVTTFNISSGSLVQVINGKNIGSGVHTLSWQGTSQARVDGGAYASSPISITLIGGVDSVIEFDTGTFFKPQLKNVAYETDYEIPNDNDELKLCQAYYRKGTGYFGHYVGSTGDIGSLGTFITFDSMDSVPIVSLSNISYVNSSVLAVPDIYEYGFKFTFQGSTGGNRVDFDYTADARL